MDKVKGLTDMYTIIFEMFGERYLRRVNANSLDAAKQRIYDEYPDA